MTCMSQSVKHLYLVRIVFSQGLLKKLFTRSIEKRLEVNILTLKDDLDIALVFWFVDGRADVIVPR